MIPFNSGRADLKSREDNRKRRRRRKGMASAKPSLARLIGRARHAASNITVKVSV